MSIKIKDYSVLKGLLLVAYHPKMIALAMWVCTRLSNVVFTSSYRQGDKGVHGEIPCRGINIRSWIYEDPEAVAADINSYWIYDPERPEKMCAKFKEKPDHLHLKAHDKTKYLEVAREKKQ